MVSVQSMTRSQGMALVHVLTTPLQTMVHVICEASKPLGVHMGRCQSVTLPALGKTAAQQVNSVTEDEVI